ncbi:TetR/AcrR family transcriptional regulator [Paenibacillus aurantiacus]|uniref:TetR/AcrR family transcriptional regulator n=1 Tax=Paenibacillus aurantiacus TaxID=1936118 RepID=A0ABV5KS72_9BACL
MKKWEEEVDDLRVKRRDHILEAARTLFAEKDMALVTMVDIGARAGVSRVTLYKYFSSIHEIVFEIQIQIMNEISVYFEIDGDGEMTGAEKLTLLLYGWYNLYRDKPEHLRFIAMFDHFYRNEFPSEDLRKRYRDSMANRGAQFKHAIEDGIRDGSILPTFDPALLETMIQNTVIGMMSRMATRGHLIHKQWGIDPEDILTYLLQFIAQFIRVKPDTSVFRLTEVENR